MDDNTNPTTPGADPVKTDTDTPVDTPVTEETTPGVDPVTDKPEEEKTA